MAYSMKKSPINKGTAAKPSPTKFLGMLGAFLATKLGTAVAAGVAGSAVAGGMGLAGQAIRSKKQQKMIKQQEADEARKNVAENLSATKIGSGSTRLVS